MLFGRRKKFQLNNAEATYKVHYLGNVMTSLVKGGYHHGQKNLLSDSSNSSIPSDLNESRFLNLSENSENSDNESVSDNNQGLLEATLNKKFSNIVCNVDKPVRILWENHLKHNGHAGLKMRLTLTQGGLRVNTKDHGLTEYYGHRIHFLQAHSLHPKLFVWVYQHVGKNLKSEIRCHAVLCERARDALIIEKLLTNRLHQTFMEYKREKRRQQNSRLCNSKNGGLLSGQLGTKKRGFTKRTKNYKPPVQHGMCSAPKLDDVLEEEEDEVIEENSNDDDNHLLCKQKEVETSPNKNIILENDRISEKFEYLIEESENDDENVNNKIFNSSLNIEKDFTYENIITELNKSGLCEIETEPENESRYENNFLKLPLSSSSISSSSITSSESTKQGLISLSESPIYVTSCSIATPSVSSSEPTISPCSIISEETEPLKNLQNDSGISTLAASIINSDNNLFKNLNLNNDETKDDKIGFNQVSYEFLSDLSQPTVQVYNENANYFRNKFNTQSKSFNSKIITTSLKKKTSLISQNNEDSENNTNSTSNNTYNPFNRSSFSKSFSTFTRRLKKLPENQIKNEKQLKFDDFNDEPEPIIISPKNIIKHNKKMAPPPPLPQLQPSLQPRSFIKCYNHTQMKIDDIYFLKQNAASKIIKQNERNIVRTSKKLISNSSNSPFSSPELSTCSDSSYTSNKNGIDNAQLIISL